MIFLLPDDIDGAKIRLYMPGRGALHPDKPVVEGTPGAVPGDIWLWVEDLFECQVRSSVVMSGRASEVSG